MLIAAKTIKGKEFLYNPKTAHKVSKRSGKRIVDFLNSCAWKCNPGEIWFVYEIDKYDQAFEIAQFQSFTIRNGNLYHSTAYSF